MNASLSSSLSRVQMADDRGPVALTPLFSYAHDSASDPRGLTNTALNLVCVHSCTIKRPACIAPGNACPFHLFLISSCFSLFSCASFLYFSARLYLVRRVSVRSGLDSFHHQYCSLLLLAGNNIVLGNYKKKFTSVPRRTELSSCGSDIF